MSYFSRFAPIAFWLGVAVLAVLAPAGVSAQTTPVATAASQHILLLYAYGYGGRGVELFSDGFFKAISEAGFPVTNVYAEYLDLQRNKDRPRYVQELLASLRQKYAQRPIDLIVTVQQPALDFLLGVGGAIVPQAPVITIQHQPVPEPEKSGRRIIGELNQFDIKGTLERALELFPQTRRVVFVSGSSTADLVIAEDAARATAPWRSRLAFEYTTGLALNDILQRVAHLPPHSIIIFAQYNSDTDGHVALAYEVENMVIKAANAPVFGFYDYNLRNGGIGGSVIAVEASGARLGRLAVNVLNGATAATSGTLRVSENIPMFDWQQIQHWGGNAGRLPPNTVFLNRPPSFWELYRQIAIGALVFILAQSALIAVLLINIRRRKRAEQIRGESDAKFRAIFDGIFDSVIFADTERRILLVNPAFTTMFGYTADEVAGFTTAFLYADPTDYADQGLRRYHDDATEGGVYQLRYRRKDGSEFWAESTGTRIHGPKGTLLGLMGMHRNITERKQAEEEIRHLNADLERRVAERTADLTAANRELDSFAYAVSHDLRAPLRAISGFLQALIEDFGHEFHNDAKLYLNYISAASNRMKELIDGILTLSRSTHGELQRDWINVSLMASQVADELRNAEPHRQIDCQVEPDLWASGDARMIQVVMRNLLANAWKYTGKTTAPAIRVYGSDVGGRRGICVADNGAGFAMTYAERLFEPFQRLHRQDEFPGIGIGLATVQRIIHRHGGVIQATAAPDQGATFCFTLTNDSKL